MPWLPFSYGHQGRPCSAFEKACEGTQAPLRLGNPALDIIKSNTEISRIFSSNRRYSNQFATFIVFDCVDESREKEKPLQHDPRGRVAFIAGKKLGNAVWRNSAKRRMREIYRARANLLEGVDVLFIARSPILKASYSKVLSTCEQTMKRIFDENG